MSDFMKELKRTFKIQKQKQMEREDHVLSLVDCFLRSIMLARNKWTLRAQIICV
jgi:hypothetical protein